MQRTNWLRALSLSALLLAFLAVPTSGQDGDATEETEDAHHGTFERYAVAADHPAASDAGASVLAAGGNAADAAAATMLALGVASPASSGMGGGGFALYYRASDQSLHFIDFRERAPAAATADMFERREGDDDEAASGRSRAGGLAVGVPGEPAGVDHLITEFGSGRVSRAQVVEPSIRLATEGVPVTDRISGFTRWLSEPMRRDRVFRRWFPRGATVVPPGTRMVNRDHARTLRDFARSGAAGFYQGRVAREIVREVRAHGGVMTAEDLANYRVAVREPLVAEHFGHRWAVAPPPSAGGITIFSSLTLLSRWLAPRFRQSDSALFRHALVESWKGPYTDRHHYLGDPDHVTIPIDALLGAERAARRASIYHPTLAQNTDRYDLPLAEGPQGRTRPGVEAGTSHLCVVDAEGNVAAVTTTVNLPFGARFSAAGVVMNDEMDDFAREVGQPNAFGLVGGAPNLPGPGRRPVSSMSPTIVMDDEGPVLCVGGSGGSRIITAAEQVALFVMLFGDRPAEAIARPRVHHQGVPRVLGYEAELPQSVRRSLGARGHDLRELRYAAVVQAIQIERERGERRLHAASDPRKGGRPAGR